MKENEKIVVAEKRGDCALSFAPPALSPHQGGALTEKGDNCREPILNKGSFLLMLKEPFIPGRYMYVNKKQGGSR